MSFLKALAAEHDVIIFDNRNVGGSINRSKNYKAIDLAEDTNYLLEGLHLSHASILGISMGGMIAQQFAIKYPKAVDHLILINTLIAGLKPTYPSKDIQADLYSYPKNKLEQYLMALRIFFPPQARFHMFFTFLWGRFDPKTEEAPISPAVIEQQRELVLSWIDDKKALQQIKQLKMPVLILSGGSDYLIPSDNVDVLHREIPHSTFVRWQDGGHIMIFQYPEEIARVINQWLLQSRQ
jgi:pimeloyl-ACP methyl ester carboxylesterase